MNKYNEEKIKRKLLNHKINEKGCWIGVGFIISGYAHLKLNHKRIKIHRIFAWIFDVNKDRFDNTIPNLKFALDSKYQVLHHCDNPICFNPNHLFLGDTSDNMQDMISKGREKYVRGEENGRHILTKEQVIEIKSKYENGDITQKELAEIYGVHQTTISAILNNYNWKHL